MRLITETSTWRRYARGGCVVLGLVSGALALSGVIPFAGYFSKEAILRTLGERAGTAALAIAFIVAGLTAYYAARMVFLTV